MSKILRIDEIEVSIKDKKILNGISLDINKGEIHVILGPNGAGKSSLGNIIMGNPKYNLDSGRIIFDKKDITNLEPHQRAREGIFLSFQQAPEIHGVTLVNFLRSSYNAIKEENLNMGKFHQLLKAKMEELNIGPSFRTREVNVGFSGGEKKRFEVLQLSLLEPKLAILDEIDSGLDVDALKLLSKQIVKIKNKTDMSLILITHHTKILEFLKPDKVHVLSNGRIINSGGLELVEKVQNSGFDSLN